jgi:hypothetical protein
MTAEDIRPPEWTAELRDRLALLASSYERLAGTPLVGVDGDLADSLWRHPSAIVAHGLGADPIFFFGNRAALIAFELDFAGFTRLPSRLAAEPGLRAEREVLLARVAATGMISDYAGIRISATGRRFRIDRTVVWNLTDEAGVRHGQAAVFDPPPLSGSAAGA